MTSFDFGDVVLVRFPFTDQSAVKQRPAVVVSSEAYHRARPDILIMAITARRDHGRRSAKLRSGVGRKPG
jgi:mRNA interferase MazF